MRCKKKRKFKATTDYRCKIPVAENLLGQQFKVSRPNMVWLRDINYVPTDEGWLYLTSYKVLFTAEIMGYSKEGRLTKDLVSRSLLRAIGARPGYLSLAAFTQRFYTGHLQHESFGVRYDHPTSL